MDEHDIQFSRGERLEAGENALLPGGAPNGRGPERRGGARRQPRHRIVIKPTVVGADDHGRGGKGEACGQRLERMHDERTAGASEILLRPIRAEPHAPAAGDDEKPDLIR